MGSPLIWLSGAQQDILARCAADRPKYAGMGSAILITATMAGISMTFALHSALKLSLATAIPFAVAWSLAIMSLDRWLVVSLVRQRNKLNYLLLALPRVLLGLLFGIIISTPLTLQIFHLEINQRISIDQAIAASSFQSSLKINQFYIKVEKEKQAVAADQAVISNGGGTGVSPASDPVLVNLNSQLQADQAKQAKYFAALRCEEGDPPSKNCVPGKGPAFKNDSDNYQRYRQRAQSDEAQITDEEHSLTAKNKTDAAQSVVAARDNLATDKVTLATDKKALTTLENSFHANNAANSGILASLKALEELRGSDATVFWAEFLLFLFFTSIECLPILVKVLLNLGPETGYEKALAHAEQAGLQLAKQEITLAADALGDETGRLHAEWKANALPEVIHDATAARDRVARSRLASWEWRETAGIDGGGPIGPGGLSGVGTGWAAARMSRWPASFAVKSRLRAAQQARRPAKTPQQPTRPSAWPYWPDSL